MPISPLLILACVSNTRLLSVSKRSPMSIRLKISGASLPVPGSTMVPPLKPACQFGTASLGGSTCASSVTRFGPATTLNGASSTRRPESHSRLTSAESISIG